MYLGHFTFEVDSEKQEDFLKAVRERIRPHWMAGGRCWDYSVYQEWDAAHGKPGNRFIKNQVMEGMPGKKERTREDQEVIDLFYSFAKNVNITVYVKKV
jgi:hypothetical protein